ncbi:MAG: dNTP triphosphohydrolase, partial [Chloroflexota bacterium]|nr:dNTP triphosphohydrolase [Chloroflexota bacterium]
MLERFEDERLLPLASRSSRAVRPIEERESPVRMAFQRDRDRIIHSKSFRRLMHKTQVFIAPGGDHYRTRLTHTLEVAQLARTVGRALRLNEDLVEAIGMGHDLGHTPFGHSGERALAEVFPNFRHNEQSLRVVDILEKDGAGLNLTNEVRDGILRHSKPRESI